MLQVPPLTNALLGACGAVICEFAGMQLVHLRSLSTVALTDGACAKQDSSIRLRAACAMMHNAERAISLLEKLESHLDPGDAAAAENGEEELRGADQVPVGEAEAAEALQLAETELGRVSLSALGVLAALLLFCPSQQGSRAPLALHELQPLDQASLHGTFGGVGGVIRWVRPLLHADFVAKFERAVLQMLVAHIAESLLCGKANLIADEGTVAGQAPLSRIPQ